MNAEDMKKVIGAVTEGALSFATLICTLWFITNQMSIPTELWIIIGAFLGKYGISKGAEIIKATTKKE